MKRARFAAALAERSKHANKNTSTSERLRKSLVQHATLRKRIQIVFYFVYIRFAQTLQ